jgi:hypothetical protein
MKSLAAVIVLILAAAAPLAAQSGGNPHGPLPDGVDCTDCHTAERWTPLRKDIRFDHAKTGFALDAKHGKASCGACHGTLQFSQQGTRARECASCHTDVHTGRFGRDCASCHDAQSFMKASGSQAHARTSLPLTGAHVAVPCESCHRDASGGSFTALDTRCISCHQADYDGVELPSHTAGNFSQECTQCHATSSWHGATFDHATASNGFGLLGAHIRAMCGSCHQPGGQLRFSPPPSTQQECLACHGGEYEREHGADSGYPTTCMTCHNMDNWDAATFAHDRFPLAGAHGALACTACHAPPDNALIYPIPAGQNDCVACHRADYDRQHTGTGFSTDCTSCHTNATWRGATFNHDGEFFPIYSGKHAGKWSSCQQCHTTPGNYSVFSCTTCHTATETNNDHSQVSGYVYDSARCLSCHPRGD